MGNCLFKKLKGTVDGNLPYFGGITVRLKKGTGTFKVLSGQTAKLISQEDGTVINISDSVEFNANTLTNTSYKNYKFVSAYNAFPTMGSSGNTYGIMFNFNDFAYISPNELKQINWQNGESIGNLNNLPASDAVHSIVLNQPGTITGDLATIIQKYPNLGVSGSGLRIFNTLNTNITGNVAALGNLRAIPLDFYVATGVTGDLYDAVVGWRTNIAATGSSGTMMCGPDVHLWSVYPGNKKAFTITWTATTSSITVNGITTTFDNSGNIV